MSLSEFISTTVRNNDIRDEPLGENVSPPDPFRALEDEESDVTKRFIELEKERTDGYMREKEELRAKIEADLRQSMDYPRVGIPNRVGTNGYYTSYNTGLQNHSAIYRTDKPTFDPANEEGGELFLDPNTWSEDGTVALIATYFSTDDPEARARFCAYRYAESGSDWNSVRVRNLETGEDMEELKRIKFCGVAWHPSQKSFFYGTFDEKQNSGEDDAQNSGTGKDKSQTEGHKIYEHVVGTPQSEDRLVHYDENHPEYIYSVSVSDDGNWLLIEMTKSCDREIAMVAYRLRDDAAVPPPSPSSSSPTRPYFVDVGNRHDVLPNFDIVFNPVFCVTSHDLTLEGREIPVVFGTSNWSPPPKDAKGGDPRSAGWTSWSGADRYNLVAVRGTIDPDVSRRGDRGVSVLVEEDPDESKVLEDVYPIGMDHFVLVYMCRAQHFLRVVCRNGGWNACTAVPDTEWNTLGSVGISCSSSHTECYVRVVDWIHPGTTYRMNFLNTDDGANASPSSSAVPAGWRAEIAHEVRVPGFDPSDFVCSQVSVPSTEGTVAASPEVPMFLVHRRGAEKNGKNIVRLYGYGGFGITVTPAFSLARVISFLKYVPDAVFAVANIRGGGCFGKRWHEEGKLFNQRNSCHDLAACAQYFVDEGYAEPRNIAIEGASNGGLLVAATAQLYPERFGAVLCGVPVLDMLRFHKFTVGRYWCSDYGNPEGTPEEFAFLRSFSPLLRAAECTDEELARLPPMLLYTADHDDRVVPLHSLKYAATVHERSEDAPLYLHVETKAGHGMGMPLEKQIKVQSLFAAYLARTLGF